MAREKGGASLASDMGEGVQTDQTDEDWSDERDSYLKKGKTVGYRVSDALQN